MIRDRRKHQSISKSLAAAQAEEHILRAQLAEVRERRKGRDKGVAERLRRLRENKLRPGSEFEEAPKPKHDRADGDTAVRAAAEEAEEEELAAIAAARLLAQEEAAATAAADLLSAETAAAEARQLKKSRSKKKKKKGRDGEPAGAGEEAQLEGVGAQEEAETAVPVVEEEEDEVGLRVQDERRDRELARRHKEEARRIETERRRRAGEEEARDKAEAPQHGKQSSRPRQWHWPGLTRPPATRCALPLAHYGLLGPRAEPGPLGPRSAALG